MFGPELTDGFKVAPDVLAERIATPLRLPQQPSESELLPARASMPLSADSEACWLARTANDITLLPAVTEKQRQVQETRIKDVLQRYALYPEVRGSVVCAAAIWG